MSAVEEGLSVCLPSGPIFQAPEASVPALVAALAEFAADKRDELGKVGPLSARLPRTRRGPRR